MQPKPVSHKSNNIIINSGNEQINTIKNQLSLIPWQLRVLWMNCMHLISHMSFRSSHIFLEGNRVADALVNFESSSSSSSFVWWDSPLAFIVSLYNEDCLGLPQFHFR